MAEGALWWVVAVNLVIWTGLFLVVLRLDRKLRKLEKDR
ncbi:MAG: CcmD family protein [Thermoanaerobaculia bacterium]